jgi:uncharacterized protein (DUF58 family)
MRRRFAVLAAFAACFAWSAAPLRAADMPGVALTLKDHKFTPAEVTIPASTRTRLTVKNLDATPAEFESDDFKAEKVIPPGQEVVVLVGPLKPGKYEFHDEYHEDASKAWLTVK